MSRSIKHQTYMKAIFVNRGKLGTITRNGVRRAGAFSSRKLLLPLIGVLAGWCGALRADDGWEGLVPYYTTNTANPAINPTITNAPPANNLPAASRWKVFTNGQPLVLKAQDDVYFAFLNTNVSPDTKNLTIVWDVTDTNWPGGIVTSSPEGYDSQGKEIRGINVFKNPSQDSNTSRRHHAYYAFKPQPVWERIYLQNIIPAGTPDSTITITNFWAWSKCMQVTQTLDTVSATHASFGAAVPGAMRAPQFIKEIRVFHRLNLVDLSPLTFSAPPGTGVWTNDFVTVDPDGNPRGKGVRWTSDGIGLATGQPYDFSFQVLDSVPDRAYVLYAFDAVSGEYLEYHFDLTDSLAPTLHIRPSIAGVEVDVDSLAGVRYDLEDSHDVVSWQPLLSLTAFDSFLPTVWDTNSPARFFRAKYGPVVYEGATAGSPCPGGVRYSTRSFPECNTNDGFIHLVQDDIYVCPDGVYRKYRVSDEPTPTPCP